MATNPLREKTFARPATMKLGTRLVFAVGALLMLAILLFALIVLRRIDSDGKTQIETFRTSETERIRADLQGYVDIAWRILADRYEQSTQTEHIVHTYGDQLRWVIDIAENLVREKMKGAEEGRISITAAQEQAMNSLRALRFDNGLGYVWINDTTRPFPTLIMHPTLPELDGTSMEDPFFDKALGEEINIGKAIADAAAHSGEGFVEYLWPKPTPEGLTADMPKLSYVRLIEEWGWILGTGVYVDDARQYAIEQAIEIIRHMRYAGGEGYFWINDMRRPFPGVIMHPTMPELSGRLLDDTSTAGGAQVGAALVDVCERYGEGFVEYAWPKPTSDGWTAPLPKGAYVRLFPPLNWVIGTGIYLDEIDTVIADRQAEAREQLGSILRAIVIAGLFLFFVALGLLYLLVRGIVRPIVQLTTAADRVASGYMDMPLPDYGPLEIRSLSCSFNRMTEELHERMTALQESEERFRRLAENLEDLVRERTVELESAKLEAEQANRAKSAFLANMSHEIRTPLNAVLGFASILERDGNLSPDQAEYIRTINRSGHHLLKLINDVLDMSRIESGQLEMNLASFSLHDLLNDMEMMFRSRTGAKGLQFLMERAEGLPRFVTGDEAKLRQILVNLIGNAVKFTKSGGVAVRSRTVPDGEEVDSVRLLVEIEDTGPGIPPEDIEHVFDAFRQSEAGYHAGGTGLGLSISRRLAELSGGSLTLKSRVGIGCCFSLSLPLRPASGTEGPKTKPRRNLLGLATGEKIFRVLIVDDVKENRDVLRALLSSPGFELSEAANGEEALKVFDEWGPHVVLMDMRMPVMDGYEATRRIKATPGGASVPVVAITASAFEDDRDTVMQAGVDYYIRKPFLTEELFEALGALLGVPLLYSGDGEEAAGSEGGWVPPSAEEMAKLPGTLLNSMREAVENGDIARLEQLIDSAYEIDAGTAKSLRLLAKRYDYEALSRILPR